MQLKKQTTEITAKQIYRGFLYCSEMNLIVSFGR